MFGLKCGENLFLIIGPAYIGMQYRYLKRDVLEWSPQRNSFWPKGIKQQFHDVIEGTALGIITVNDYLFKATRVPLGWSRLKGLVSSTNISRPIIKKKVFHISNRTETPLLSIHFRSIKELVVNKYIVTYWNIPASLVSPALDQFYLGYKSLNWETKSCRLSSIIIPVSSS